jgi:uroporphyrinogen-III synthase
MPRSSFDGLRVLALESRRANEIGALIRNFGGVPIVAPALREVPISSNTEALSFGKTLLQGGFDAVVFLTGVGARALINVLEREHPRDAVLAALRKTKVAARGPKPVAVLREWEVPVWVTAPEPNTWHELMQAVGQQWAELPPNPRVAIQEYGVSNEELVRGLEEKGASVTRVPVYQWRLPEDLEPLKRAVSSLTTGDIDVALFTTGVQVGHLFEVADMMNVSDKVKVALTRVIVGSVGPTTSEELRRRGIWVDLEASHPKMGVLVTEAAARAKDLLNDKREES